MTFLGTEWLGKSLKEPGQCFVTSLAREGFDYGVFLGDSIRGNPLLAGKPAGIG